MLSRIHLQRLYVKVINYIFCKLVSWCMNIILTWIILLRGRKIIKSSCLNLCCDGNGGQRLFDLGLWRRRCWTYRINHLQLSRKRRSTEQQDWAKIIMCTFCNTPCAGCGSSRAYQHIDCVIFLVELFSVKRNKYWSMCIAGAAGLAGPGVT